MRASSGSEMSVATDISEPEDARMSPSMNDLTLDQVIEAFERSVELTPVLAELPWEERRSFNGLLSVTTDGGSIIGESPDVKDLWLCEAVWVKDGRLSPRQPHKATDL